ncbi:MAG: AAA family ATPase, partial [Hydrogenovibrio sp.]|nr:AAA family ATPase [Hydrogenovibrio sp.]
MYLSFFGLEQPPFQALPSPAYYVNFAAAEDTALSILFSITAGKGVIKVTGESGTGKTVMVTHIEEQLPINYRKVTIHSPCLNAETCLKQLCHEIGISVSERDTELRLIAKLHQTFLQEFTSGYRTIIFVDDAHLFQPEVLKTLCLLSYLKTRGDQQGDKLVQVVLLGTPALDEKLETPSIEDWGQRINSHIEMPRLDEVEVMHYTNHRMKVAGYSKEPVFDLKAARKIQRLTSGVPEVINRLADQLLVTAYKCGD